MGKIAFAVAGVFVLGILLVYPMAPAQGQKDVEKEFLKLHEKELTLFMTKCSACHSLQRVFAKEMSKEEWAKVINQMKGKPHAGITDEEQKKIQQWIEFMKSAIP